MHWRRLEKVLKKGISPYNYPASTLSEEIAKMTRKPVFALDF